MMAARWESFVSYALVIAFSAFALYPLIAIILLAFHPPSAIVAGFSIPDRPSLESFSEVWDAGYGSAVRASAIVTLAVVFSSIMLAIPAGYAFGTMRFWGSRVLFYVMMVGIIVPYESTVIPLYYDLRELGLTDTYWALILPQVGISVAFGTFWMRAFFLAAPRSLIEAARLDGASSWVTLWRVLAPLGRPAILTLGALIFVFTWNEFLLALVMIQDEAIKTAPLILADLAGTQFQTERTLVAAAACLLALPPVLVYIFLQRHFIRGMLGGSIDQ